MRIVSAIVCVELVVLLIVALVNEGVTDCAITAAGKNGSNKRSHFMADL